MKAQYLNPVRAVILGFFLAIMVSLVVPTLLGTNVAHALGFGIGGAGSVTRPVIDPPHDGSTGPITETPGTGEYDSGTCGGLRPLGIRTTHAIALCQTRVVDLRNPTGSLPLGGTSCSLSTPGVVGVRWVNAQWWETDTDALVVGSMNQGNIRCISVSYRDVNAICLNNATVDIGMFIPAVRGLSSVSARTPWGNGDHSYSSCYSSNSLHSSAYVPIVDYGRYSAQFRMYGNVVTFRVFGADPFTGVTPAPELLSDSGPQLRNTGVVYLQFTCSGATNSDTNNFGGSWTWTENDCAPGNSGGNTPTFQCVNMDSPTVNGVPRSQTNQILRDGDANSISWLTPNVVGGSLRGLTNPSTTMTVSGTPTFANSQLSLSRDGAGIFTNSSYTNSIATNYELKARWASDKDNPVVLSPSYTWMGTWEKTSYAITGINFDLEDFEITPVTVMTQSPVTCTPANVSFDVLRATNG